jgi:hypothetical protein
VDVLYRENDLKLNLDYDDSQDETISRVVNKSIDFAIVPNNSDLSINHSDLRTIVPLLPRLLFVFYKGEISQGKSLKSLLENHKVAFEPKDHSDSLFFERLFYHFNVLPERIDRKIVTMENLDEAIETTDVFISLSHTNNPILPQLLDNGFIMYSFGDFRLHENGSVIDGFCLSNPKYYPFILPMGVYHGHPEEPILTVAVQDILICHQDMDEGVVYTIIKTINEEKTVLAQRNRIYGLLDFNFNHGTLAFQLHEGALNYLNKDQPTAMERYADIFGLAFSILVFAGGVIISFRKAMKMKRKNRVEDFIIRLLKIKNKLETNAGEAPLDKYLDEVEELRNTAVLALVNEELTSNDEFQIFLGLYNQIRNEIATESQDNKLRKLTHNKNSTP